MNLTPPAPYPTCIALLFYFSWFAFILPLRPLQFTQDSHAWVTSARRLTGSHSFFLSGFFLPRTNLRIPISLWLPSHLVIGLSGITLAFHATPTHIHTQLLAFTKSYSHLGHTLATLGAKLLDLPDVTRLPWGLSGICSLEERFISLMF